MITIGWHSACEEYQKEKKKIENQKIEMKPSDVTETPGKMRHVAKKKRKKAVAWKRAKLKKHSPVVLFSERHRRQRLAKLNT